MPEEEQKNIKQSDYPSIISAIRSPLSLFALAMLICNAVFSLSAAWMKDLEAFTYAIHTFLSIVGTFVLIALWSPSSLFHPKELQGIKEITTPKLPKIVITISLFVAMFSYMGYQIYKIENLHSKDNNTTQTEISKKQLNVDAAKGAAPAN